MPKIKPDLFNHDNAEEIPRKEYNISSMPQEFVAFKKILEDRRANADYDLDLAETNFNKQYGRNRFNFYQNILSSERTLQRKIVDLPTADSNKGYIVTTSNSRVGKYSVKSVSVNDMLSDMFPNLKFDENYQFTDGDYVIRRGMVADVDVSSYPRWVIIDIKNNSFMMDGDNRVIQAVPHDLYIGPFETKNSAGFRHEDGTVEHLKANPDADVKKYLDGIYECYGVSGYALKDAEFVAKYVSTPEELAFVNSVIDYVNDEKEHGNLCEVEDVIKSSKLSETEYMGIAKLMPFSDNYADTFILHRLGLGELYNADGSERVTDKATIERVQDAFGRIRACYYGENSMTKTLETQMAMALNAESMKQREDAMDIIEDVDNDSLSEQMNIS